MRKFLAIAGLTVVILAAYTLAARADNDIRPGWLDRHDTGRPHHSEFDRGQRDHRDQRMVKPYCLRPEYQNRCGECHRDDWQKRAELDRKLERLEENQRQRQLDRNGYKTFKGPSFHWP